MLPPSTQHWSLWGTHGFNCMTCNRSVRVPFKQWYLKITALIHEKYTILNWNVIVNVFFQAFSTNSWCHFDRRCTQWYKANRPLSDARYSILLAPGRWMYIPEDSNEIPPFLKLQELIKLLILTRKLFYPQLHLTEEPQLLIPISNMFSKHSMVHLSTYQTTSFNS